MGIIFGHRFCGNPDYFVGDDGFNGIFKSLLIIDEHQLRAYPKVSLDFTRHLILLYQTWQLQLR